MLAAPAPAALSPTKVLFADSFADDEGPPLSPAARPYTASLLADRPGTTASSSRGRSPARTPVTSPLRVSFDDLAAPVEAPTRRTTTKLHVDDGIPHSQKYRTRRSTGPVMTRDLTRAGRQASVNDVGTRNFTIPKDLTASLFSANDESERILQSFAGNNFSSISSLPVKLLPGNVIKELVKRQESHSEFHVGPVFLPTSKNEKRPTKWQAWPIKEYVNPHCSIDYSTAPTPKKVYPNYLSSGTDEDKAPPKFKLNDWRADVNKPKPWCNMLSKDLDTEPEYKTSPYPRRKRFPESRPEWLDPNLRSAWPMASTYEFLPAGRSVKRIRPLNKAILRKLRAMIEKRWPRLAFSIEQAPDDCLRVTVEKSSFQPEAHLALRAFLRNLTWDDRLLDRRVAFKHSEEDTEATVSALYYVLRTGVKPHASKTSFGHIK